MCNCQLSKVKDWVLVYGYWLVLKILKIDSIVKQDNYVYRYITYFLHAIRETHSKGILKVPPVKFGHPPPLAPKALMFHATVFATFLTLEIIILCIFFSVLVILTLNKTRKYILLISLIL